MVPFHEPIVRAFGCLLSPLPPLMAAPNAPQCEPHPINGVPLENLCVAVVASRAEKPAGVVTLEVFPHTSNFQKRPGEVSSVIYRIAELQVEHREHGEDGERHCGDPENDGLNSAHHPNPNISVRTT